MSKIGKLIELSNIEKKYPIGGDIVKALDGISLSILKNEFIAITGSSGSGKSTLMNILGCLDTPCNGSYYLDGTMIYSDNMKKDQKISDRLLADIRNKRIGFIFQTFNLLSDLTALQNVELPMIYANCPKKYRLDKARELLEVVKLSDRTMHKPNELSGGQRQRVAIARALVNDPSIILADEPTGNLDSKTSREIMDFLDQLHERGNTIIIVTHEEDIAMRTKRTINLNDGKITTDRAIK
jgi:putative ABC transport system ATP-binding protein